MRQIVGADCLPIFLRAHTEKVRGRREKKKKTSLRKWPEFALIFDTETRTLIHQKFMFLMYRVCRLVDGQYRCIREGMAYSQALNESEWQAIEDFARTEFAEVETVQFPPVVRLEAHDSLSKFLEGVFFPALR